MDPTEFFPSYEGVKNKDGVAIQAPFSFPKWQVWWGLVPEETHPAGAPCGRPAPDQDGAARQD